MSPNNFSSRQVQEYPFLQAKSSKPLYIATLVMTLVYFSILTFWFPKGNPVLFTMLVIGEIFHMWQIFSYVHTVWDTGYQPKADAGYALPVDVFITVAGEPVEIVETTARAALAMEYGSVFRVHLLNDGKVAKKENWKEIEELAQKLGIACITREKPGGAKAGNINHALSVTFLPLVAVFDADQVPEKDFLKKMVGYFKDEKMGFVQSPQFYKNRGLNEVTGGAWEQQELFFGPISKGKNRLNSVFMCGTNMVIRRTALEQAGGMCETNIAEDFLTSLFVHEKGWKSVYVPEVLVKGLAPEDFLSYYKQQFRWARGSLEVLFKYNPLVRRRLSGQQEMQYLASASYYLSGVIVVLNALLPLAFFYFNQVPLKISTMGLAAVFIPYILLVLLTLRITSNFTYTFRALAFSMSSFTIHFQAIYAILTNQKTGFSVTSKKQLQGNFWYLVIPHLAYIILALVGIQVALMRDGLTAALLSNTSWALFNIAVFLPFVLAAMPSSVKEEKNAITASQTAYRSAGTARELPDIPRQQVAVAERKGKIAT